MQLLQQVTLFQEVLNLDGGVECKLRELLVQGARDAHSMRGTVEEVRVAESNVARTSFDLRADTGQHDLKRDREEASVIDRRDGTVQAGMLAAACGLGVAHYVPLVSPLQARVAWKRWERSTFGHDKWCALYPRSALNQARAYTRDSQLLSPLDSLHKLEERNLVLAANGRVDSMLQQVIGVQQRVESIHTDMRSWIKRAHALRELFAQAQSSMHGYRDSHEARLLNRLIGERCDRRIGVYRSVSALFEHRSKGSQVKGLVAQFVA